MPAPKVCSMRAKRPAPWIAKTVALSISEFFATTQIPQLRNELLKKEKKTQISLFTKLSPLLEFEPPFLPHALLSR